MVTPVRPKILGRFVFSNRAASGYTVPAAPPRAASLGGVFGLA
jgi:hypothetical protein